jgi:nucleoside-diphosphate-sugar epimerase
LPPSRLSHTKPSPRNLAILKSAHAHLPSLKSIVFTGSVNAVSTGFPSELSKGPLTNSTWLPLTPTAAREANDPYLSYCSGKKEGELAIWSFLESSSPSFSVTVLLPAIIIAPPIQASSIQNINYSAILIYNLMNKANEKIPPTTFPSYIDGRDLADAHVKALTAPGARNKRFLVGGMDMTFTELVRALKKVPELEGRVPAESGEDKNVVKADIDAKEGNETLEMTFRSLEETMRDIGLKLLALEKA